MMNNYYWPERSPNQNTGPHISKILNKIGSLPEKERSLKTYLFQERAVLAESIHKPGQALAGPWHSVWRKARV